MTSRPDHIAHPYCNLHIPRGAPFTLHASPQGKGWGAFATQPIPKGSIILQETPVFTIPKPHHLITEQDINNAFQKLPAEKKSQFLSLRYNAATPFPRKTSAFAENSFAIPLPGGEVAYGFFPLHSRLNHSCLPNVKIPDQLPDDACITSYAVRDIEADEELVFCYELDFTNRTRADRHRLLRFQCQCRACEIGTEFQVLSEMRRTLLNGLEYLTRGRDTNGGQSGSIIVDRGLRKEAEGLWISLSSRFIYSVLTMALMEQEGLMDGFLEDRMRPHFGVLLAMFQTVGNIGVAKSAFMQTTWTDSFCVAASMWGQRDAGDDAAARMFRNGHGVEL